MISEKREKEVKEELMELSKEELVERLNENFKSDYHDRRFSELVNLIFGNLLCFSAIYVLFNVSLAYLPLDDIVGWLLIFVSAYTLAVQALLRLVNDGLMFFRDEIVALRDYIEETREARRQYLLKKEEEEKKKEEEEREKAKEPE